MSPFIAMFSFSLATSISPGPVNIVIVSSGASFGVRQTFSFVFGATIGITLLLLFIGLGFYKIINLYPLFLTYLGMAGSMFLIYVGYLIGSSKPELNIEKRNKPTFFQGFLMQWLNPKAWIICVTGVSLFSTQNSNFQFLTFSLIYFLICFVSLFSWSVLGDKVTLLLNSEFKINAFNKLMGGLLILTACFLLYAQIN